MLNFEQGTRGERILRQQATPLSRERSKDQILKAVKSGDLFGMVQVNIGVPEKLRDGFYPKNISCRLFQWNVYSLLYYGSTFRIVWRAHAENIGTLKKPRRLLVDGMKAENIFIATPHLRWYPPETQNESDTGSRGHRVSEPKLFRVIRGRRQQCEQDGNRNKDILIIGGNSKPIGNSGYWSLCLDKTKHRQVKYVQGENATSRLINQPLS